MFPRTLVLAAFLASATLSGATAKEFRFAFQSDVGSMDPYNLNEAFSLGIQGNVYEGLTRRDPNLAMQPALSTGWQMLEPTRWRFTLRPNVAFHDGKPFTADDVVFSAMRVRADGSDLKSRVSSVADVVKVDDRTVDFVLRAPNPLLPNEWDTWYILSKAWAEENNASQPLAAQSRQENFATRNANGTGPFRLVSREPDVRSVFAPHEKWWDTKVHNLTRVTMTPIATDATRVAALLSGQVDMAFPVPAQDVARLQANPATKVLLKPEVRTIFLGMDQSRDELLYSDVKGKNPLKDRRVRLAFYQAIDIQAIRDKVMRGLATPAAMMVGPGVAGFDPDQPRYPFDPIAAKKLLEEAGYPNGFRITLDCPNDRYNNDEAICQAVVPMLARIGITVDLKAIPKAQYFGKIPPPKRDTSFYLLGWTAAGYDSLNTLGALLMCPSDRGSGPFNVGGYCNPEVDRLTVALSQEADLEKRAALTREAWRIVREDVAYLPLHNQILAWGVRSNVDLAQRADDILDWRHITVR